MIHQDETVAVSFPSNYHYPFCWRAIYHDGRGRILTTDNPENYLLQFPYGGGENKYKDIDRFRLARFDLINRDGKVVYSLFLHNDQRLIWRNRQFIRLDGNRWEVTLVGWQTTVMTPKGARNITVINYLFPDGTVALDNHRNNLELLPEEY